MTWLFGSVAPEADLVYHCAVLPLCHACRSPGLTGTLALLSGYLLHLDPFGGLDWDGHDAYVGVLCILPLLLLGAAPLLL